MTTTVQRKRVQKLWLIPLLLTGAAAVAGVGLLVHHTSSPPVTTAEPPEVLQPLDKARASLGRADTLAAAAKNLEATLQELKAGRQSDQALLVERKLAELRTREQDERATAARHEAEASRQASR